jgi:hypothetical protein
MAETASKKETVVETVTMTDGRVVDFPGKKRLQKDSYITAEGKVSIRFDFRNGKTLTLHLRPDMIPKYAAHGAEQKGGDEIAGVEDLDDAVLAVEELISRLNNGEWTVKREGSGMSGTSVLLQAIVKVTSKPLDAVKAYLATKSQAQKLAIRESDKFRVAVAEIEAEKAKGKTKVDITADLVELDNI